MRDRLKFGPMYRASLERSLIQPRGEPLEVWVMRQTAQSSSDLNPRKKEIRGGPLVGSRLEFKLCESRFN
jgi:hypothetical protein